AAAYLPPSAWAMITDSECATMSCISRAMRARSAAVAICACWSRSTSSRAARSASVSICTTRARRISPTAQDAITRAPSSPAIVSALTTPRRSDQVPAVARYQPPTMRQPSSAEPSAVRRAQTGPYTVTEYSATKITRSDPDRITPASTCASAIAYTATDEPTGRVRRQASAAGMPRLVSADTTAPTVLPMDTPITRDIGPRVNTSSAAMMASTTNGEVAEVLTRCGGGG